MYVSVAHLALVFPAFVLLALAQCSQSHNEERKGRCIENRTDTRSHFRTLPHSSMDQNYYNMTSRSHLTQLLYRDSTSMISRSRCENTVRPPFIGPVFLVVCRLRQGDRCFAERINSRRGYCGIFGRWYLKA